jgi:hypothetical protein
LKKKRLDHSIQSKPGHQELELDPVSCWSMEDNLKLKQHELIKSQYGRGIQKVKVKETIEF